MYKEHLENIMMCCVPFVMIFTLKPAETLYSLKNCAWFVCWLFEWSVFIQPLTLLGPVWMQSPSAWHPPLLPSRHGLMASKTHTLTPIKCNKLFNLQHSAEITIYMLCVLPFKQTYKRILFHRLHNPGGTRIFSVLGEFACTRHEQSSHRYSLHMRPPLGLKITMHIILKLHLDSLATNVSVLECFLRRLPVQYVPLPWNPAAQLQ